MVMRLRDVLLRQSSKLPGASPRYMGRGKDIASSVNQEVFQNTQMMKHAVQGVHVQLPIMHTSKVVLIVQRMKALTGLSQSHLSSSMVLLSVESAAKATSTGVYLSSTFANLCFPLKN